MLSLADRIEAALAALRNYTDPASVELTRQLEALRLDIQGDFVAHDQIVHGDSIRGNKIENYITNQTNLPDDLLDALQALVRVQQIGAASQLTEYTGPKRRVRIFISSPGDVSEERGLAERLIDELNSTWPDRVQIIPVMWDRTGARMPLRADLPPQDNVDLNTLPSECDIVIVLFWSKMGMPLPADRIKPEAFRFLHGTEWETRYLSGTEYEFVEAMQAAMANDGKPTVLVYWRKESVLLDPDADDFEERVTQKKWVNAFFDNFTHMDGVSARWSRYTYQQPADFESLLREHLDQVLFRLLESSDVPIVDDEEDELVRHWDADRSPFPGLRAFEAEDELVFVGREHETDALMRRLNEQRFVAVVAASGSGKSSLVRAGVIPRLQRTGNWRIATVKPGTDPLRALATSLMWSIPALNLLHGADFEAERDQIVARLKNDPAALIEEALTDDESLLLFVDQFEELFTLADDTTHAPFGQVLNALTPVARIIITMRADFYERCLQVPSLKPLLEQGTYPLYPPGRSQLYAMITRPAGVAGLTFEGGLAERLWRESGSEPGALALTAYALQQLWESRNEDGLLTHEAYNGFGGVEGAIGQQAEAAYNELDIDDEAKDAALKRVFARLVAVERREDGSGYTATRRRTTLSSFDEDAIDYALIDGLANARLLVTDYDPLLGENVLEVAHEALFRSWGRLKAWIDEAGDAFRLIDDVKRDARRWQNSNYEDDSILWPQRNMDRVTAILADHPELEADLRAALYQRFLTPEYTRIRNWIQTRHLTHDQRAQYGDDLNRLGDCEKRPGVGLVTEDLPPLPTESDAPMLTGASPAHTPTSQPQPVRLWGAPNTLLGQREDFIGLPDIAWMKVEPDVTSYAPQTNDGELGPFPIRPFYMAKYAVTYRQYRAFLEADDGFSDPRWWQGLSAREDYKSKPGQQKRPTDNHPAEKVNWYDAVAFCQWLNHRLGFDPIPPNLTPETLYNYKGVRLPTEWEWQYAATGGDDSLQYPWGPDWEGDKANTTESGLSRTTAVGMYPAGAAPTGLLDMSGNVYDWCLNEYSNVNVLNLSSSERHTVRGGAWSVITYRAAASYRSYRVTSNRVNNLGVRLARSYDSES